MNKMRARCITGGMGFLERIRSGPGLRKAISDSRDRLYGVAFSWCGDAMMADDLVQETLILALQKVHQLRDRERLNAWLYSILSNCWKRQLRDARPVVDFDSGSIPCADGPAIRCDEMEVIDHVRQAILKLPPGQRQTITLVDLEGFSYAEVANILAVPIGTVMSRLHTARNSLQKTLMNFRDRKPARSVYIRRVK